MQSEKGFTPTLLVLVITIALITGLFIFTYTKQTKLQTTQSTSSSTPSATTDNSNTPSPSSSVPTKSITLSDPTWLPDRIKIPSLTKELFNDKQTDNQYSELQFDQATYYKIATFAGGQQLIDAFIPTDTPAGTYLFRFIKDNYTYYYLRNKNNEWTDNTVAQIVLPTIGFIDQTIKGLEAPQTISSGDKKFTKIYDLSTIFSDLKNPQKVGDNDYGTIYEVKVQKSDSSLILVRNLYLKLKDQSLVSYELTKDFDGKFNKVTYDQRVYLGCGYPNGVPVINNGNPVISDISEIGQTTLGKKLYQIKNSNNTLLQELYNTVYKPGREGTVLTLEQYAAVNGNLLYQDQLGDYQVYINPDYGQLAECGKPVIYLYPTKQMNVSVKVGASITKSVPLYPANGWEVTAFPNGTLNYQNTNYDSLFWEGLGNGLYPNYSKYGVVVKQADVESTLKTQLIDLGLTNKESSDFLAFWLSKIPTTPYVRLTWLNTQDMNRLAPLTITPKPDTLIRVFLETEGLNQVKTLIPQKLHPTNRIGFTVVEWGGLLRK